MNSERISMPVKSLRPSQICVRKEITADCRRLPKGLRALVACAVVAVQLLCMPAYAALKGTLDLSAFGWDTPMSWCRELRSEVTVSLPGVLQLTAPDGTIKDVLLFSDYDGYNRASHFSLSARNLASIALRTLRIDKQKRQLTFAMPVDAIRQYTASGDFLYADDEFVLKYQDLNMELTVPTLRWADKPRVRQVDLTPPAWSNLRMASKAGGEVRIPVEWNGCGPPKTQLITRFDNPPRSDFNQVVPFRYVLSRKGTSAGEWATTELAVKYADLYQSSIDGRPPVRLVFMGAVKDQLALPQRPANLPPPMTGPKCSAFTDANGTHFVGTGCSALGSTSPPAGGPADPVAPSPDPTPPPTPTNPPPDNGARANRQDTRIGDKAPVVATSRPAKEPPTLNTPQQAPIQTLPPSIGAHGGAPALPPMGAMATKPTTAPEAPAMQRPMNSMPMHSAGNPALRQVMASNAQQCQAACRGDASCRSWAWVQSPTAELKSGCHVSDRPIALPANTACCVSGTR